MFSLLIYLSNIKYIQFDIFFSIINMSPDFVIVRPKNLKKKKI